MLKMSRKQKIFFLSLSKSKTTKRLLDRTFEYTQTFRKFKTGTEIKDVRKSIESLGLQEYENAFLLSICPNNAEEAKALLKSLERIDDDRLNLALEDIQNFTDKF